MGALRLRRSWRRLRLALSPRSSAVVFAPEYSQPLPGVPADPFRAEKIVGFLTHEGLLPRSRLLAARRASFEEMLRVHDAAYLESLSTPAAVTRILGLEVSGAAAESAFALQRFMAGGTVVATREALRTRSAVLNLGGGLHHAERAAGSGFCMLNDIAIAVAAARAEGFDGRILVVDLDHHDGNGTRALLASDPGCCTYSIHRDDWGPPVEGHVAIALGPGVGGDQFRAALHQSLPRLISRFQPELAFYVSGSDVLQGDALGDWQLSGEDVIERDQFVAHNLPGLPLVVTLAGGYGEEAWRCGARFAAWLLAGERLEPPGDEQATLQRLRGLARSLLAEENDTRFTLDETDILPERERPAITLFLDRLSRPALELSLERAGLLALVRARGYLELQVDLQPDGGLGGTLRLSTEQGERLVELRAHRSRSALAGLDVLLIEWLMMQDPRATFAPLQPPLPGQKHPGLGLLRPFLTWLVVLAELGRLDGVAFAPAAWHTAKLSRGSARFVDPVVEARLQAFNRAVEGLPLAEAATAIAGGRVRDESSQPVYWQAAYMALPVSRSLRDRIAGQAYEEQVEAARAGFRFHLGDSD